jgi:hypothetical protein
VDELNIQSNDFAFSNPISISRRIASARDGMRFRISRSSVQFRVSAFPFNGLRGACSVRCSVRHISMKMVLLGLLLAVLAACSSSDDAGAPGSATVHLNGRSNFYVGTAAAS